LTARGGSGLAKADVQQHKADMPLAFPGVGAVPPFLAKRTKSDFDPRWFVRF